MQPVGRVENAAAPLCYLGIAETANLVDKFLLTTAGIYNVRVGIAPRRKHGTALGVDDFHAGEAWTSRHGSVICNPAALHRQISVGDGVQLRHLLALQTSFPFVSDTGKESYVCYDLFHDSIASFSTLPLSVRKGEAG